MGIFGALSTAVTGLKAQSYAMENIPGDIANSQTTGFKRLDTSFVDLIPDAPSNRAIAGSVLAYSHATNTVQGDLKTSDNPTHMAINGTGFFIVDDSVNNVDNRPIFSGINKYTRRGDFEIDRYGYLKNGAGYYLKGLPVDNTTGNITGTVPEVVRIVNDFQPARPTSVINYKANLPAYPRTPSIDSSVTAAPNQELLKPADFAAANPLSTALGGTGHVLGSDTDTFISNSIDGGGLTTYDANGTEVKVQLRWAKTSNVDNAETWNLFYQTNTNPANTDVAWQNLNQNYVFGSDGKMNPEVTNLTIANLTVDGTSLGATVLQHGTGGLTQYADAAGTVNTTDFDQNGYAAGQLASIAIDENGGVIGTYTNSRTQKLAQIQLAVFKASDALTRQDGGVFLENSDSGSPVLTSAGSIQGGALESSNVDVADEFTKLIVTQQAYTANTRVVTTGNQMLQETLNMLR